MCIYIHSFYRCTYTTSIFTYDIITSLTFDTINMFLLSFFFFKERFFYLSFPFYFVCVKKIKFSHGIKATLKNWNILRIFLRLSPFSFFHEVIMKMIVSPRFLSFLWKNATMLRRFFGFRRGWRWISAESWSADPGWLVINVIAN